MIQKSKAQEAAETFDAGMKQSNLALGMFNFQGAGTAGAIFCGKLDVELRKLRYTIVSHSAVPIADDIIYFSLLIRSESGLPNLVLAR
jgi:hypothetical protein